MSLLNGDKLSDDYIITNLVTTFPEEQMTAIREIVANKVMEVHETGNETLMLSPMFPPFIFVERYRKFFPLKVH